MRTPLFILVAAICSFSGATALPESTRWFSEDRFYSLEVPKDWTKTEVDGPSSKIVAWQAPQDAAELTISATYNLRLPEVLPDKMIGYAFKQEEPITEIRKETGEKWDALYREYRNKENTLVWFALMARNGSTAVLLTLRVRAADQDRFREKFQELIGSLRIGEKENAKPRPQAYP
jgi:hypothetical protein